MPNGVASIAILFAAALVVWGWTRLVRRAGRAERRIVELGDEIKRLQEEIGRHDAAKSEFIAMASHQLKAPLAVIHEYVRLFLEGALGPATALARQSMQKVFAASGQLLGTVSEFFELARLEQGRLEGAAERVALDALAAGIIRSFEPQARAKGIHISFENRGADRRATKADPVRLNTALAHLVDNAVRYTAAGRVHVELLPEIRDNRGWLKFAVSDTGIGIRPSDIGSLFTKFGRTEEARRIRPDGLGLGLYAVKRIIEEHGGEVGVTSPGLGQGSVFWLRLPSTL
ncbi:MAG: HAMP domain-containing histidine kinase [Candidatus Sungbacteria bacterium]|uniref:histidine kinase n=1 Tax=Candidatus Sungiibacteriota bacterium TaxID=2750080 RepID=A0A932YXW0_9BACT|nr:HAMP domain-containing histidine kinase [Candidatus Sungbacteria bacterium]